MIHNLSKCHRHQGNYILSSMNMDIEQYCELGRIVFDTHFLNFTFLFWNWYSQIPFNFLLASDSIQT